MVLTLYGYLAPKYCERFKIIVGFQIKKPYMYVHKDTHKDGEY